MVIRPGASVTNPITRDWSRVASPFAPSLPDPPAGALADGTDRIDPLQASHAQAEPVDRPPTWRQRIMGAAAGLLSLAGVATGVAMPTPVHAASLAQALPAALPGLTLPTAGQGLAAGVTPPASLSGDARTALEDLRGIVGQVQGWLSQQGVPSQDVPGRVAEWRGKLDDLAGRLGDLRGRAGELQPAIDAGLQAANTLRDKLQTIEGQGRSIGDSLQGVRQSAEQVARQLEDFSHHQWIVPAQVAPPAVPDAGRRLFAGATLGEWASGDSWAGVRKGSSFGVSVNGEGHSSLTVGQGMDLAGALGQFDVLHPRTASTERGLSLLDSDPRAQARAGTELTYRSPYVDVSLKGLAGAAVETDHLHDLTQMYRRYEDVPGQVTDLVKRASTIQRELDLQGTTQRLQDLRSSATDLATRFRQGQLTPAQLLEGLQGVRNQVDALRPTLDHFRAFASDSRGVLEDAATVAGRFQDEAHHASMQLAVGTEGRLDVVGRIPVSSPTPFLKDLSIGVKASGIYVPDNPTYDASRSDMPQLRYMLGATRTQATVIVDGIDVLHRTLADFGRMADTVRGVAGDIEGIARGVGTAAGQVDPAKLEQLQQLLRNATHNGVVDQQALQQAVAAAQQIAGQVQAAAQALPDLASLEQRARTLQAVSQDLARDVGELQGRLHVATDVSTRVVQPTSNFGAGLGLGIAGTLDVPHDMRALPHELRISLTVDNLVGYMPGKDEVWKMKTAGLEHGQVAFEKVSETHRNVYQDFNPRTWRGVLSTVMPLTDTNLIGGVEKVEGLPGVTRYFGAEQPVTNWLRLRGGVMDQTSMDGRMYTAGVAIGGRTGPQLDINAATDSMNLKDTKNAAVSAQVRWNF